jgi:hypothetical protein
MHVGYYIAPKQVFFAAAKQEPFQACAQDMDDDTVILWASFQDAGHEARFRARAGVEALPDARSSVPLSEAHVAKLSKFGIQRGHITLDVSAALEKAAGSYMRLPNS